MDIKKLSRRDMLKIIGLGAVGTLGTACATQTPQVIKEVVKETVVVEKEKAVVTEVVKEVTKEVEKQVTSTPMKGQLRVATINDPGVLSVLDLMIAGFKGAYPGVEVKVELQSGDYTTTLNTQAASGTLPDVVWNANLFTVAFANNGVLKDLMPFIDADPEFNLDDIFPAILGEAKVPGKSGLYYLPASLDVVAMYYNKTAFEQAGAEIPTDNWTWDDYIAAGLKISKEKDKDGNPKMWMLDNATWNWCATVLPWIVGYGGDVMDTSGTKSTWSSDKSVAGLEGYTGLWTKHKIAQPLGTDVGGSAYVVGRAATYFHIPGLRKYFQTSIGNKFVWDVALPPKFPDGKHWTGMGSYGFGIYEKAKQPKLAWDFLRQLVSPQTQIIMGKTMAGMPLLKSLAKDPTWLNALTPPPTNNKAFLKAAEDGLLMRIYPEKCGGYYTGIVNQTYIAALEAVIRGQKDVKTAFTEADQTIQT